MKAPGPNAKLETAERLISVVIRFIITIIAAVWIIRVLRRRNLLFIEDVQDCAVFVFIDHFEPPAVLSMNQKPGVIIRVVGEHIASAKTISNQRPGIFFFS